MVKVSTNNPRVVRFRSNQSIETVEYVTPLNEYDSETYNKLWCTAYELSIQRHALKCELRDYTRYGRRNSDNMTFSSLGLTTYVGHGKRQKQHARNMQMSAVRAELYEQWLLHQQSKKQKQQQQKEGQQMPQQQREQQDSTTTADVDDFNINDEELAIACSLATQYSRDKAHQDALQLQDQVQNLLLQ